MSEDHDKKTWESLARIEATLDAQNKAMELYQEQIAERLNNHGGRIKSLEVTRNVVQGAAVVIGVIGSVIWHKIQDKFNIGSP